MKEIKLLNQKMQNFMGIRDLVFEPQGRNATLRGDNGTFKTSTASALSWLLFDKDIHGNSTGNFSIKTTDENEQVIHGIDHIVEAELSVNGKSLKLKKNYREVWSKKRKVLKSHKTDYWIDDIPNIKKKDYIAKIAEIIPEETFRLLTDINYFNSDKFGWQNRRKILFQLCEGLSEEALDVAEKAKKILASKKRTINEKRDGIQPRIDEKNRDLAAIADYNKSEIEARIADLEGQIQIIKSDSGRAVLLKEQSELEAKLSLLKADQAKEKQEATAGIRAEIEKIEDDYAKTKHMISDTEYEIGQQVGLIVDAKTEIKNLRQEFDEVATNQDTGIEDVCPACGQDIPKDQKEAALTKFNQQKSEKLEEINTLGKKAKGFKGKVEADKVKLETDLRLEKADIVEIKRELDKKKVELENILSPAERPQGDVEIVAIQDKIDKLTNDIRLGDHDADTSSLEYALKIEMAKIAKIDAGEDHKIRIIELGEQEKSLCAEIERLESDLFKAEENIQEQARLLEIPINAKFGLVKFQLFEKQMNEGVRPTCIALIDGIPYGHGLNKGNEINAGLDIIRTLSQHYGIQCPIFIDNCESISYPIDPGCQCFKLIKVKDMELLEITYG
jgi:hypothetical protein